MHNFERFNLKPFLIEGLVRDSIEQPTEIQERLLPSIKRGADVIGKSQTGTGKTLAFLLPILHNVDQEEASTQYVVTAPTRELATQLFEVFKHYANDQISVQLVVGGTDRLRMVEKVRQQKPHIVIGTPGRILDMIREQALLPAYVKGFVVDEADQMLDMGFLEEVDSIASAMNEELQLMVFSATIPERLMPFLKKYMKNPKQIEVQPRTAAPKKMEHWLINDRDRSRKELIQQVTERINPFLAIVFTNTKESANEVFQVLQSQGLNVDMIHGGVEPRKRKKVLKKLQDAEIQYLVATDLIARGIDIKGISHIINYEIPTELEYYVHRVGRTARAGWDGLAMTIYGREDERKIEKLKQQGINFVYKEWKNGAWETVEKRVFQRKSKVSEAELKKAIPRKPKKVKPGYKKKARQEAERKQQRERRINRRKTK